MTLPLSRRPAPAEPAPRRTPHAAVRAGAATAVAGLFGLVLAPALAVSPAAAVPASCGRFGAAAAGDLVTLRMLDLRPIGIQLAPVLDLKLATSRAGLAGGTGRTAAQARYVNGDILGVQANSAPLDAAAYQIAPPANPKPTVVNPARVDLGFARAGTGDLFANAAYRDNTRCDADAGAGADASSSLLDTAVVPGARALLRAPNSLSTSAHAGLVRHRGGTGVEAASTFGHADLSLLGTVSVRVLSRPALRAVAGGSAARSTVDYTAPVVAVDLPDGRSVALDQPAKSIDLAVPDSSLREVLRGLPGVPALIPGLGSSQNGDAQAGAGAPRTGAPAATEPAAAVNPANPTSAVPPAAGAPGAPPVPGLEALRGVPGVGGLLGAAGPFTPPIGRGSFVIRLTAGELSKEVNDSGVHAKAISLRLKVVAGTDAGMATLVDLCVGVLEVAARAGGAGYGPGGTGGNTAGGYGSAGGQGGEATTSPAPSGGAKGASGRRGETGKLPLTGSRLGLILGTGVGLLTAGRLLMVLARRRMVA